jgi:two-component system nitrogen regulation sensor histidine kinase NtrY
MVAVSLSLVSSLVSFLFLTGALPYEPTPSLIQATLAINIAFVSALVVAVILEVWRLASAWRQRRAAAGLHLRIMALFSIIAVLPAALVAAASALILDQGLDRWFETRTRQVVDNSLIVASAYMQEHARVLRGDMIGMATAIDAARTLYDSEPIRFESFMRTQATLRGIQGAYLLQPDGTVIIRTELDPDRQLIMPPAQALAEAANGPPVLISPGESNQVGGILKLIAYDDVYLYVVRSLDPQVLSNLRLARESAVEYRQLEESRGGVQMAFGVLFAGFSLVLLLAAIYLGLAFANGLVAPIRRLITAAGEVADGNLHVRVPVATRDDDLASLGRTFNKMTTELGTQRDELLAANDQVDRRRRFTEAVLSGVTPAVVGVTNEGKVSLVNRSATLLLSLDEEKIVGRQLTDEVPELEPLLAAAIKDDARVQQGTVILMRGGLELTVSARIASDRSPDREHGYVVTLDDISDLVMAQRASAWGDVARRIAHEIKNPLTPIQLSAERIRRRFGKVVVEDRAIFDQCVDTIVRQVGDIGRMVDEFSAFARMPKATMEAVDLRDAIREAVFLQSVAHPETAYDLSLPEDPMIGRFDNRLLSQAMTNLVKNASEAIAALPAEDRLDPRVEVAARMEGGSWVIDVIDNGIGLPQDNRHRLLEPYMTTREKGTGLGLAIVRKVVEEHRGRIDLLDAPAVATGGRGAMVRVILPAGLGRLGEDEIENRAEAS